MSTGGKKKRYTSVMEKIIKNAVSETSKVLETVIAELKAEVKRVKSENENLQIRCSQFEEVVKKRSVYRETGTSPEPWIIEKCDKAVQCDFLYYHSDEDQNISDNEAQSESSFSLFYEKESSTDSFSFLKSKDIKGNSCNPLDLSNRTTPEKPIVDCDENRTEGIPVDKCCLDPQFDNMESKNSLETSTHSLDQEYLPTVPHVEQHTDIDTCYETSEMEIQKDVCVEYAKTDQSLLECQEADPKGLVEKESLPLQEDICVSTEREGVVCEKSANQLKECESSSLCESESASSLDATQRAREETIEMDVEIHQQLNTGDSSTAEPGNTCEQVNVSADVCSPPDQPETPTEDLKSTHFPTESEQSCTEMTDKAAQSISTEDIGAKEAQSTLQPVTPQKAQYFLRRQRCTSVTLEDAMLLLDAVNQQKYRSSTPKKLQTRESSKNVATQQLVVISEETAAIAHDGTKSEEMQGTTEVLQPHATPSNSTSETAEALKLDVCTANLDIDCEHEGTSDPSKTCLLEEPSIACGVPTSTKIKQKKFTQLTEADSASLNFEDQHDHQNILSPSESTLVSENTTPNPTPTKSDETIPTPDTPSMDIEDRHKTAPSSVKQSPPKYVSVPVVAEASNTKKTSAQNQLLEMGEINSPKHDYQIKSLSAASASLPTKLSSVQPEEGDRAEYLSAPTENGEAEQVTPDYPTQKDSERMEVGFTPPIDSSPSKQLSQTVSAPTVQTPVEANENVAQISSCSPQESSKSQQNNHKEPPVAASSSRVASPLLKIPAQHTMVVQLPGESSDPSSSIVKAIASSSSLSPAQLSAVVSAVRSTQSKISHSCPSGVTSGGKKAFVAVPFSLQSVMRPHHKIIVIPRQCKVPTSQAITKDKAIVLKQKEFATEMTTTFISTNDFNSVTTSDSGNTKVSLDQSQTTSVTTTTHPLPDTSPVITDASPVITDASPVITDASPVITNASPVITGASPVIPDASPVIPDASPVITGASPVITGACPVITEASPVITDASPVITDASPVITGASPVIADTSPVITDTIPVITDTSPVMTHTSPVITDTSPVITDTNPVITHTSPVITDTSPVITDTNPVITHTSPVITDTSPVITDTNPVITDTSPVITDTSPVATEPSSSCPVQSQCKSTVQIKLNRIQIPVSSAQPSVSMAETPINAMPRMIVQKKRGRPPLKKNIVVINSNQPKAQPKENNTPCPINVPSPNLSSKEATPVQSSPRENTTSTVENQLPTPAQLSPIVAADHSYPQYRMTKSQFLAKLEVSPVTELLKKADDVEKDAQKASLVDRLRSHLKPHIRTIKRAPKTDAGQEKNTVDTNDSISTTTQDTSRPNQGQPPVNVLFPNPVPHHIEIRTVTPRTPPAPKNAPNKVQVKRKRSPKRALTPPKTVKRRQFKKEESNENIISGRKLSPMRSKIINSNALLSCVRKGIKKKSFLCKFCRKEFSKKKDIEVHIQVHVGKKPFQCNICHRRFSRTMELSRHLKRHNAEKKYQCTSCGKAFIEYNNLKRHTYIHTGEKPYTCPHCPRAFTQSGHMRTHMKNKHKDLEEL